MKFRLIQVCWVVRRISQCYLWGLGAFREWCKKSVTQSISQINNVIKCHIKALGLKAANYYCPLIKFNCLWKNLFPLCQLFFHKSSLAFLTQLELSYPTLHIMSVCSNQMPNPFEGILGPLALLVAIRCKMTFFKC